jgi:hypothetical protein
MDQGAKFCCKRCKAELGVTNGLRLIVGSVEFRARIPLRCLICQVVTVWYPPRLPKVGKPQNVDAIPVLSIV